jgi:hypothetical protein
MDKFNKLVNYVLNITDYVIAWVNKTAKGVIRKLTGGLDPNFNQSIDDVSKMRLYVGLNEQAYS